MEPTTRSLPPGLVKLIETRLAAGASPEALRDLISQARAEWNVDPAQVARYLMTRFRQDEALRGWLLLGVIESEAGEDLPQLPPELDRKLRAGLGLKSRPRLQPALPEFSSIPVSAQWNKLGPIVSEAAWRARHYERLCQDRRQAGETRYWARKCWLQWRSVERLLLLDNTALVELEDWSMAGTLEPEIVEYLQECQARMTQIAFQLDGVIRSGQRDRVYAYG